MRLAPVTGPFGQLRSAVNAGKSNGASKTNIRIIRVSFCTDGAFAFHTRFNVAFDFLPPDTYSEWTVWIMASIEQPSSDS